LSLVSGKSGDLTVNYFLVEKYFRYLGFEARWRIMAHTKKNSTTKYSKISTSYITHIGIAVSTSIFR
jgi:hypothetical protein